MGKIGEKAGFGSFQLLKSLGFQGLHRQLMPESYPVHFEPAYTKENGNSE